MIVFTGANDTGSLFNSLFGVKILVSFSSFMFSSPSSDDIGDASSILSSSPIARVGDISTSFFGVVSTNYSFYYLFHTNHYNYNHQAINV